jgi:Ca2+-binding RTX toxin-like protein
MNESTRLARIEALEPRRLLSAQLVDVVECPDGQLLTIAYDASGGKLELARFNGDGSRDTGFGSAGKVSSSVKLSGDGSEMRGRVAVDAQTGRIAIAYPSNAGGEFDVAMFSPGGDPDASFAGGGKLLLHSSDHLHDLVMTADGRITHASDYLGVGEGEGVHWLIRSPAYPSGTEGPAPWNSPAEGEGHGTESMPATGAAGAGELDPMAHADTQQQDFDRLPADERDASDVTLVSNPSQPADDAALEDDAQKASAAIGSASGGKTATPTAAYLAKYLANGPSKAPNRAPAAPKANADAAGQIAATEKCFFLREPTDPKLELNLRLLGGAEENTALATLNHRGSLIVRTNNNRGEQISVYVRARDGRMVVRVDNFVRAFVPRRVRRIAIFTGDGDDVITIGPEVRSVYVDAGDGNDTIYGSQQGDVLVGGLGKDKIFGSDGDDILVGGGGNDSLVGGAGKDDLYGNGGVDTLSGCGGNDRLDGGAGADSINGGPGDDAATESSEDSYKDVERRMD